MTTVIDRAAISAPSRGEAAVAWDARQWILVADARDALRLRGAFRDYLVGHGHPASDFHAAEVAYGELLANCLRYAPGPVRVEFHWSGALLTVVDCTDRLRSWPFAADDCAAETTYHAYALLSGLTRRVHLAREPGGGTRATVVLPVLARN